MKRCIALGFVVVAAGCASGPSAERLVPATSPAGARVDMYLGHRASGADHILVELLEVRDTAVVVLGSDRRVWLFGYGAIFRARCPELPGGLEFGRGVPPPLALRDRLRLVSRFPGGLNPQVLEQLLHGYGQTALEVRLE